MDSNSSTTYVETPVDQIMKSKMQTKDQGEIINSDSDYNNTMFRNKRVMNQRAKSSDPFDYASKPEFEPVPDMIYSNNVTNTSGDNLGGAFLSSYDTPILLDDLNSNANNTNKRPMQQSMQQSNQDNMIPVPVPVYIPFPVISDNIGETAQRIQTCSKPTTGPPTCAATNINPTTMAPTTMPPTTMPPTTMPPTTMPVENNEPTMFNKHVDSEDGEMTAKKVIRKVRKVYLKDLLNEPTPSSTSTSLTNAPVESSTVITGFTTPPMSVHVTAAPTVAVAAAPNVPNTPYQPGGYGQPPATWQNASNGSTGFGGFGGVGGGYPGYYPGYPGGYNAPQPASYSGSSNSNQQPYVYSNGQYMPNPYFSPQNNNNNDQSSTINALEKQLSEQFLEQKFQQKMQEIKMQEQQYQQQIQQQQMQQLMQQQQMYITQQLTSNQQALNTSTIPPKKPYYAEVNSANLSQPAFAGDTVLQLTTPSGVEIGMDVVIGHDFYQEMRTIVGLGSIYLDRPLEKDYPIGTIVKIYEKGHALPPPGELPFPPGFRPFPPGIYPNIINIPDYNSTTTPGVYNTTTPFKRGGGGGGDDDEDNQYGESTTAPFMNTTGPGSYTNTTGAGSYTNTAGAGSYTNTTGAGSYTNTAGAGSYTNTTRSGSYGNTTTPGSYTNTTGYYGNTTTPVNTRTA